MSTPEDTTPPQLVGMPKDGQPAAGDLVFTFNEAIQAGNLFRLLTDEGKRNLIENIAGALSQADAAIQDRQIGHFLKADPAYGEGVAAAIGRLLNRA